METLSSALPHRPHSVQVTPLVRHAIIDLQAVFTTWPYGTVFCCSTSDISNEKVKLKGPGIWPGICPIDSRPL
jgi:hypothetical protein